MKQKRPTLVRACLDFEPVEVAIIAAALHHRRDSRSEELDCIARGFGEHAGLEASDIDRLID